MSNEKDRDSASGIGGGFSGTKPTGPMTGDDIGTAVDTGGYSGSTSGDVEGSGGLAGTTSGGGTSETPSDDPDAMDDNR